MLLLLLLLLLQQSWLLWLLQLEGCRLQQLLLPLTYGWFR
jgi:hypothetical protein